MGIESRIEFAQGTNQFFPGSFVNGTVILELDDDVSARYVKLRVHGDAKTQWTHHRTIRVPGPDGQSRTKTISEEYKGLVSIIDLENILWGNGEKDELPAGEHHFKFQFQLPMHCFPEFQSSVGNVRYYCKLIVDRPWKFDHTNERPFAVSPVYDLNASPHLMQPQSNSSCEKIGMPLFRRGEIAVKVNLSKTGYDIGETILALVEIDNRTSKDVEHVKLIIYQYADYVAFHKGANFPPNSLFVQSNGNNIKDKKTEITSSKTEVSCPSRANTVVEAIIDVPNVTPTFECAIIRVYYKLKVEVKTSSTFNSSVDCKVPIVICSGIMGDNIKPPQPDVPLMGFIQPTAPVAPFTNGNSVTPSAPPLYPSLQTCEPPPPYTPSEAEAIPIKE